MKGLVVYIHGKGGNAGEAAHYRGLFGDRDVVGFDYSARSPWEAVREFPEFFDAACEGCDSVVLIANSIGAFFAMSALSDREIAEAFFISPIVDMEKLIMDMMTWADVTEDELRGRGEIQTEFGETLSWEYLSYVRAHPVSWSVPTHVLYGEKDNLTSYETMAEFAEKTKATLDVMKDGEHWFHTKEQTAFLDSWLKRLL